MLISTGVPVFVVVPVGFVISTLRLVLAVIRRLVPLFPVAPPVKPEIVTRAPTQALRAAPDAGDANVYFHVLPDGFDGGVTVLSASVVISPVTVGVTLIDFKGENDPANGVVVWPIGPMISVPT